MPFIFDDHNITSITTLHGYIDKELWIFLAGYMSFFIPIALANNAFIVFKIVSLLSKSHKVDQFLLCCILNIACSDLQMLLSWTLPKLTTTLSGRWILGNVLCKIVPFITPAFGNIEINTLVLLTMYKVFRVWKPSLQQCNPRWIATTYIMMLEIPLLMIYHGKPYTVIYYNPLICSCDSSFWNLTVNILNFVRSLYLIGFLTNCNIMYREACSG